MHGGRIAGDEPAVDAVREPFADPAHVERDGRDAEDARLQPHQPERLRPRAEHEGREGSGVEAVALDLAAWGTADPYQLTWLDAPPASAFAQARELLRELQAIDPQLPLFRVTTLERELIVFARTWRGSAFSAFVQPLLFLGAMGLGLGGLIDDKQLGRVEAIINSMTPKERNNHQLINGQRRKRIAKGSGTSVEVVNKLLKQFVQMQKMLKQLGGMAGLGGKAGKMRGLGMMKGLGRR